jgi:hypothetical protein
VAKRDPPSNFKVESKYIFNGELPLTVLKPYIKFDTLTNLGKNKTPKKSYKTITVKADVYDYFFNEWLKVKDDYAIKKGIQSFSAYVSFTLTQMMNKEKK